VSDPATFHTEASPALRELIEAAVDFADLVRLTRICEIEWVAEDRDGEGDATAIIRLVERLQQMLPTSLSLSDEEDSARVLEEAIFAAYRHSGSFDGQHVRLALTEPTLFGQASIETNISVPGNPIMIVIRASDGSELEHAVLCPGDLYYVDLSDLLEDVADGLCDERDEAAVASGPSPKPGATL
jgi:hypothetical protein